MPEWLSDNKEWIAPATSIGTLLVWVFYAQLLYSGYSRQTRPRLLINKGVGEAGIELEEGRPVDPDVEVGAVEFHVVCIYGSNSMDSNKMDSNKRFPVATFLEAE